MVVSKSTGVENTPVAFLDDSGVSEILQRISKFMSHI